MTFGKKDKPVKQYNCKAPRFVCKTQKCCNFCTKICVIKCTQLHSVCNQSVIRKKGDE